MNKKAIVLFSGGQDSTTCLYWALNNFDHVTALNINYGQRHRAEIDAAKQISKGAGIELIEYETDVLKKLTVSALLNSTQDILSCHQFNKDLPASFVPGRNVLFITVASIVAFGRSITNIVTGVCQTDYSGYPDCRDNTIKAMQIALNMGLGIDNLVIHTPLMWLTKAETIKMALEFDGCFEALGKSVTCYEGKVPACGICPSCKLRAKGFAEAGCLDPASLLQTPSIWC